MKKIFMYNLITLVIWFTGVGASLVLSLIFGFALDWAAIKFCSIIMIAATACCTIFDIIKCTKKKHTN